MITYKVTKLFACAGDTHLRRTKGVAEEGGLNIGQPEGLNMQILESKTRSNQLLLTKLFACVSDTHPNSDVLSRMADLAVGLI